jgi:hypothetical protein
MSYYKDRKKNKGKRCGYRIKGEEEENVFISLSICFPVHFCIFFFSYYLI